MKVTIGYYEVEIEAKVGNRDATGACLNDICLWCYKASRQYKIDGYEALSDSAREAGNQIFDSLQAEGYFKDICNSKE